MIWPPEKPNKFDCPNCEAKLRRKRVADGWRVWCPISFCSSDAAQLGASGRTPTEAVNNLNLAVNAEWDSTLPACNKDGAK